MIHRRIEATFADRYYRLMPDEMSSSMAHKVPYSPDDGFRMPMSEMGQTRQNFQ